MSSTSPITRLISERLREARLQAGLTVREAAQQIGLRTHTAIVKYEQGDIVPPLERLEQLAHVYNISLAGLFLEDAALMPIIRQLEHATAEDLQRLFAALGEVTAYSDPTG